jgi:hypothetical protein
LDSFFEEKEVEIGEIKRRKCHLNDHLQQDNMKQDKVAVAIATTLFLENNDENSRKSQAKVARNRKEARSFVTTAVQEAI